MLARHSSGRGATPYNVKPESQHNVKAKASHNVKATSPHKKRSAGKILQSVCLFGQSDRSEKASLKTIQSFFFRQPESKAGL